MRAEELADRLEKLEAAGESTNALVGALQVLRDPLLLWRVADSVVPYPRIMGAIYQRASELGASEDTALGYLALSHIFDGEMELAAKVLGSLPLSTRDPVVLAAWVLLGNGISEQIDRLEEGLKRCPGSIRLWRMLATEALRAGQMDKAREAHLWLFTHEVDHREKDRVAKIISEHRWT